MNPTADLPSSMIDRMTLIIDTIGGGSARLGIDALVRRTGLPRSTVRRIVEQLVRLNWVTAYPDGFGVGRRLGGGVAEDRGHLDIRTAAARHLHRLHVSTGLVAHLGKQTLTEIFFLDKLGGRGADSMPTRVGGRAPLHTSALGKAIIAWLNPEDVDDLFHGGLARRTTRTITDLPTLHEELGRIRSRHGVAYEIGETVDGLCSVGVAIRSPNGFPVASIALAVADPTPLEPLAPLLLDVSRRIARELYPKHRDAPSADELAAAGAAEGSWSPQALETMLRRGDHDWQ